MAEGGVGPGRTRRTRKHIRIIFNRLRAVFYLVENAGIKRAVLCTEMWGVLCVILCTKNGYEKVG